MSAEPTGPEGEPTVSREASPDTLAIHADHELNPTPAVSPPIFQTATFRAGSAEEFLEMATTPRHSGFYSRYGNPTLAQAEAVLAALEGAEAALVTGSGMSAIATTVLSLVAAGDHVVAQRAHYGGTTAMLRDLLPRLGIDVTHVPQAETAAFAAALRPETKLVLVETPSNPRLELTDLGAVAQIARAAGAVTLADNTFASPVNSRPIELGIDLVAHSGTKYLGGHSDLTAGVVVGTRERIEKVWRTALLLGSALGPFDAWLLLRGVRTLGLRVERQNASALALARFLERHAKVSRVHYPGLDSHPQHELARRQMRGFGGMLSIEFAGGTEAAERFLDALKLFARAASLGGIESLAVRPAAMLARSISPEEFRKMGIAPDLVRLSVGVEAVEDLRADLEAALEVC